MKFYIPTSNLNLDNILQSECILPPIHYPQRCSGYKSFEQIVELRSFETIVLFKYPIQFQIHDTGRYNFPILIELEDDKQTCDFADKEIQDGVCLCNHRLNLTPLNCRIFFYTESAYKLTLINAQSNKAIKYFKEYKIYPTASMLKPANIPQLNKNAIENSKFEDNIIDKQKGLFYAFLLGNKMSVNRDLARQLRLSQELYNILTNLIASPSSIISFRAKLTSFIDEYKKIDIVETSSSMKFKKNFDEAIGARFRFLKDSLIAFLEKIECWDLVRNTLCEKWSCSFLPDISKLKTGNDFSSLRNEIERRTLLAASEYSKGISNDNLNAVNMLGDNITIAGTKLVNVVIKYIIDNSITPEILSAKRMDFYMNVMREIVSILKVEIGEQKWQESKEKKYVNGIYAFINDPAFSFDLNSIDNIELKSIAAFILRGQSFKDCIAYLRINEIEDYRYVLSLWGCLCGYMEMSKEALSNILTMDNYELVYKKMFNTELAKLSLHTTYSHIQAQQTINYDLFKFILNRFKYKESDFLIETLKENKVSEDSIEMELDNILNTKQFKKATKQCESARSALQMYLKRNDEAAIKDIIENVRITSSGKKDILNKFGFDEPKKKSKKIKTIEPINLFSEQSTNNQFYELPNLESFSSLDDNAKRRLKQNWRFTKEKYSDDRYEHIKYFVNLCKKEGRGDSSQKTSLYNVFTAQLAEQIEKELLNFYGI